MWAKSKKIHKNHGRLLLFAVSVLALLLTQLSPLIPSPHAYAAEDNDKLSIDEQHARTELYALMECLDNGSQGVGSFSLTGITSNDISNHRIWASPNWGVAVGYEISPQGDSGTDPGTTRCADIDYNAALGFLKDPKMASYDDFANYLFKQTSSGGWVLKRAGVGKDLHDLLQKDANKRKQPSGPTVFGPKERERRALVALAQCVTSASNPNFSDVKINGKPYNWRGGVSGSTQIPVGNDWDSDGQLSCQTLVNIINKDYPNALKNLPNGVTLDSLYGDPQALAKAGGGTVAGNGGGGGGGSATTECDKGDFSLNWILCPIYNGVSAVTKWMFDSVIGPLLKSDPICLDASGANCDNTVYKIWSSFRIYGDIFLIIALLVIVFGESIGGGLIDAYTAKKILPRLLAAAILINLSIYITAFLVDITNVVGGGIGQLLTAPLQNNGAFTITPSGIQQNTIIAGGGLGLIAGGFALGFSGIVLLLVGLAITGALAILGVFVTLIIRQSIIIALILLAPVAFALWCLPNTSGWFKRWWDTLFQMLLVYPMIVLIFAVADIMSYITEHNGQGGPLSAIIAFMLLVIPLYLIPFTLRSSNRILGAVQGTMSNIGRQINGATGRRAIAGAGQQVGQNLERMQSNRRFNPNKKYTGGINRRLNSTLSNITSPGAAAKIYGGSALRKAGFETSMGQGIMNQIEEQQFQHSQKLGERLNQMGFNDRALRTLMGMDDYSAGSIRQKATELRASGNPNDRLAANQLESNATFLSQSLYKDPEMGRADIGVGAGLAVTAQGFSDTNEVADLANRRGGQGSGLATAFVTQAQLNGQRAGRLDMKAGYGIQLGSGGKFVGTGFKTKEDGTIDEQALATKSVEERNRLIAHQIKRIQTTGQQEIQAAKGGSVAAMAPGFQQMLLAAKAPPDADGNYVFKYQNENGQAEELKFSPQEVQRVAAMLGTAQADYSGTAAATNTEIQKIIDSSDLEGDMEQAYLRGKRENIDASRIAGGGEEAQQQEDNTP